MKDPFWIALVVLLVLYVGAYFGLISANDSDTQTLIRRIDNHTRQIKASFTGDLPGYKMITALGDQKAQLVEEYKKLSKFYMDRDERLETWFQDLTLAVDEDPERARFESVLSDHIQRAKEELTVVGEEPKPLLVLDGDPKKFDEFMRFVTRAPELMRVQKCWWMYEQAMNACRKHNVKRINSWSWDNDLGLEDVVVGMTETPTEEIDPNTGIPVVMQNIFGYNTIHMEFSIELPYSSVSTFLEELLGTDETSRVMFGLTEVRLAKQPYDRRVKMKKEDIFWPQSLLKDQETKNFNKTIEKIKMAQESIKKNVILEIEMFAYDFFQKEQKK